MARLPTSRRRPRFAVVVVAIGAVLSFIAAPVSTPSTATAATRYLDATFTVDVQHDVVYGTATNLDGSTATLTLDLYTPHGDTVTGRPVFIYAHGGYFVVGDKSGATVWATRMAQRGYVAASINYRLGAAAVTAPVDTPTEFAVVNNARADMQTAVRWFRSQAIALGIDADRIAVGGVSAGAVTALGVALGADAPLPGDHGDESSAVCTALSISGANEPTAAGPDDAGAIFFHGAVDDIVPYAQAVATRDAMLANGLAVSWTEFPGEGHALSNASLDAMVQPAITWLYQHVATAPYPCSPAVGHRPRVPGGRQTAFSGTADRSAVVSIVGVDNTAAGYVQALACGTTPGGSSNLNADAAAQIRSGLAVVAFDGTGQACLFNQVPTHLVVDLQGYFATAAFDDVADVRLLDTRVGPRPSDGAQVMLSGRPDATAVVSLVTTQTSRAGYVQVLACGATPGASSNLNADAAGQTRAGLAFVHFDHDGHACVYVQRATHLVADLQGYMVAGSFDDSDDVRILDTRAGARPAGGSVTVLHGRPSATGVVSIVATDTAGAGYVQVLPCAATPGASSNLNVDSAGQTIAGLAFVAFDASGTACVFNQSAMNLIADVQGYLAAGAFDDVVDTRLLDTRVRPPG